VAIADACDLARPPTLQQQYNPLARENELEVIPSCQAQGLGILPWSPLGGSWPSKWSPAGGRRRLPRWRSRGWPSDRPSQHVPQNRRGSRPTSGPVLSAGALARRGVPGPLNMMGEPLHLRGVPII
jgi:aryl-alcohol dehydrogenase-like predicted oxidoreductase